MNDNEERRIIRRTAELIGIPPGTLYKVANKLRVMLKHHPYDAIGEAEKERNKLLLAAMLEDIPEGIWLKHEALISFYAKQRGLDDFTADRVANMTLEEAHRSLHKFRGDSQPITFLYGIAQNCVKRVLGQNAKDAFGHSVDLDSNNEGVSGLENLGHDGKSLNGSKLKGLEVFVIEKELSNEAQKNGKVSVPQEKISEIHMVGGDLVIDEAMRCKLEAVLPQVTAIIRSRSVRRGEIFQIMLDANYMQRDMNATIQAMTGLADHTARARASEIRRESERIAPEVAEENNLDKDLFLAYITTRTYAQEARKQMRRNTV